MPAFVRERVATDDRLVRLHGLVGHFREHLARFKQVLRFDPGVVGQAVLPDAERHHEFLERGVAGALADPVDRAFDLPHAALNGGEAVGDRQAEVVVAMRAEDRFVGVGDARHDFFKELARVVRDAEADRVGQVDRRRPVRDRGFDDAAEEVAVAARGIFRRKLDIVGELPRAADAVDDLFEAGLARDAELLLEVQIRGGEEHVNPLPFGRLERARRFLDVLLAAAGERRNHRASDVARHLAHRLPHRRATRWGSPPR